MLLMVVCELLVLAGLVAVVRWGACEVRLAQGGESSQPPPAGVVARRYARFYLLILRWLPAGRLGGLAYGLLLLVIAGTTFDPLRADNPDFDIVGPGWVAVAVFSAVVVVHGMLVAALAGRYSRVLPLPSRDRCSLIPYAPLIVLVPVAPAIVPIVAVGAPTVWLSRLAPPIIAQRVGPTVAAV